MMEKFKNQKGITLIALVITIIVLLILAGVSIAMLAGENGILKQATRAREETEDAQIREQIYLATIAARTANDGALTKHSRKSRRNNNRRRRDNTTK